MADDESGSSILFHGDGLSSVFQAINSLVKEGIISSYALCGAVAALFYTEAIATYDIDLYAFFSSAGPLIDLTALYRWADDHRFEAKGEHIVICGTPVQILASANQLTDEAIEQARNILIGDIEVRVTTPEFLAAIALATHRSGKDYERVRVLIESGHMDRLKLDQLVQRHNLTQWWQEYEKRYG